MHSQGLTDKCALGGAQIVAQEADLANVLAAVVTEQHMSR
jgi:hypothetical protein